MAGLALGRSSSWANLSAGASAAPEAFSFRLCIYVLGYALVAPHED